VDPRRGVCLLVRTDSKPEHPVFLGSCFSFRTRDRFITAAHCVRGLDAAAIGVFAPKAEKTHIIDSMMIHPKADVAILRARALLPRHEIEPFVGLVSQSAVGDNFMAYGFPEDVFGPTARRPTPRLFKGHFQRYFPHESHLGYNYFAGEMSIGCPAGLSGGPVFADDSAEVYRVHGVVTENLRSTTVLDAIEEHASEGKTSRQVYREVINYGLCVMLGELGQWLDKHAPAESV
jgi:hypothetical protein